MKGVLLDGKTGKPTKRDRRPDRGKTIRAWTGFDCYSDGQLHALLRYGYARFQTKGGVRYLVPNLAGAGDDPVGVPDLTTPAAGVSAFRTRQRTISSVVYNEQYVIAISPRVDSGVYHVHSGTLTVQAAAHATTSPLPGFLFIINRSAAQMVAIRRVEFIESPSAITVFATLPRVTFERFTFTGTPTVGLLTPAKHIRTSQNGEVADAANVAECRTATTSLTTTYPTELIYAFLVRPVILAYTINGASEPPCVPEVWYPEEGEGVILANGEGIVFRQPDAGTASDTRKFHLDVTWEEYTLP